MPTSGNVHRFWVHGIAPSHQRQHSELSSIQDVPIFVGKETVKTNVQVKTELETKIEYKH